MDIQILSFVLETSWCLAIFYFFYLFLLRGEKTFGFNRSYLIISVLFSFILPFLQLSEVFNPKIRNQVTEIINSNDLASLVNPNKLVENSYQLVKQNEPFNIIKIVFLIYLIVVVFLFIKMIIGIIYLHLLIKKSEIQKKEDHTIVFVQKNYSPFSFFKYVFVNVNDRDSEKLSNILKHELVHIKEKHSNDNLFLEITSILQWYNPFIWLIKKSVKEIHEYSVDEKVIEQGFNRSAYSTFLLNQIVGIDTVNFTNCFNKSLIKKRLIMMEKIHINRNSLFKKLLVIPLVIIVVAFTLQNPLKQNFDAANFNFLASDKIPKGWFEAGNNPTEYDVVVDNEVKFQSNVSVRIASLNPKGDKDFGTLMQTISADEYLGKRLSFSGYIKVENANKGAALWMRIDGDREKKPSPTLKFDNMNDRMLMGSHDWKKFEIVLDVPQESQWISFGMMLYDKGKSWFANLEFEEVDKTVPETNISEGGIKTFPRNPVNLKFE